MKKLIISSIVAAALVFSFANVNVFAANLPSSKAVVAGGTIVALRHAIADTDTTTTEIPDADDTGWIPIMHAYIKAPKDKGFAANVSLQSAICTFTEVKSKGGAKDTAQATGRISVRVKLTNTDTNEVGYAEPSEDDDPDNGVTYSYRMQELSATFQGLIEDCIATDGTISINDSCLEPEVVSLLLKTLSANSFVFYYGPTDSGVYKIEVQARAQSSADLFDTQQGSAKGEAYVGLGSMSLETVRLIHGSEYGGVVELP